MRILVTGGAGFIGSHIVDGLVSRGDTVLVVDDLSTGKRSNLSIDVELVEMDIGSPEMFDVAREFGPEAITHLAAQASVAVSMAKPAFDARANILGGINLCEVAIAAGCSQFVYINTGGALYGIPEYLPCDEDHPIRPTSAYGLSKWTLECYLRLLLPESIPLKVLRLANVYGPRQDPHGEAGVVSIFGARMVRGDRAVIFGDGKQTRDFIYVGDVVRAHNLALHVSDSLTVNVSTGVPLTIDDLFQMMADETEYHQPPLYQDERTGDLKHSVLANSRAQKLLGWRPEMSLRDGIHRTLDWVRTGE